MGKDTLRIKGDIIVTVEDKRKYDYDISGSAGRYAFRATIFDMRVKHGIMGSRVASLEMWRAKKTLIGSIRVFPVVRCKHGQWSLRPHSKKDLKACCALFDNLDKRSPKTSGITMF